MLSDRYGALRAVSMQMSSPAVLIARWLDKISLYLSPFFLILTPFLSLYSSLFPSFLVGHPLLVLIFPYAHPYSPTFYVGHPYPLLFRSFHCSHPALFLLVILILWLFLLVIRILYFYVVLIVLILRFFFWSSLSSIFFFWSSYPYPLFHFVSMCSSLFSSFLSCSFCSYRRAFYPPNYPCNISIIQFFWWSLSSFFPLTFPLLILILFSHTPIDHRPYVYLSLKSSFFPNTLFLHTLFLMIFLIWSLSKSFFFFKLILRSIVFLIIHNFLEYILHFFLLEFFLFIKLIMPPLLTIIHGGYHVPFSNDLGTISAYM